MSYALLEQKCENNKKKKKWRDGVNLLYFFYPLSVLHLSQRRVLVQVGAEDLVPEPGGDTKP